MNDGLEVFWVYVGQGDCTVLRHWQSDQPTVVVVDGGYKQYYSTLKALLISLGIKHIDAIVSSHPDRDHIGGLIELVRDLDFTIGKAWLHMPRLHVAKEALSTFLKAQFTTDRATFVQCSVQDELDLETELDRRGIPKAEPFTGATIGGFLQVWGPTKARYERIVKQFTNIDDLRLAGLSFSLDALITKAAAADKPLEDNPQTSPENDSSTILFAQSHGTKWLLTADAGHEAVHEALAYGGTSQFDYVHAPHHGSRHNITQKLLNQLQTTHFMYSAEPKEDKPHPSVRRAVQARGFPEYGTWVGELKRSSAGTVPDWGTMGWQRI